MKERDEIKGYLAHSGMTISSLERKLAMTRGTLRGMLHRGTLKYSIAKKIASAAGYRLIWERQVELKR